MRTVATVTETDGSKSYETRRRRLIGCWPAMAVPSFAVASSLLLLGGSRQIGTAAWVAVVRRGAARWRLVDQ